MPVRISRASRGIQRANATIQRVGGEIRLTRVGAGLAQRDAAAAVGLSRSVYGRIERGEMPRVTVRQLSLACAAVGLEYFGRAYPDDDPVRDEAHRKLLERFRARLPRAAIWRTEVPLPVTADRRAWDATCQVERTTIAIEAEMRLEDIQALERKVRTKQRDGAMAVVILLVADTRRNREVLTAHREALRSTFPLDTRAVLGALERGRPPAASGIVVL